VRRARVEARIGTAREPRDLLKGPRRDRVGAFVEHERLHAEQSQLARDRAKVVNRLLHGVPDKDKRLDGRVRCLISDVAQDAADLGVAAAAADPRH
jgi:hypothetical protein